MTRRLLLFAAAITLSASIGLSQAQQQQQQQPLPPSLAAAAARAAAAAHAHTAALGGVDGSASVERSGGWSTQHQAVLSQQQQPQHHNAQQHQKQRQQQRRHLLAPKDPPAPAPAEEVDSRFANFTISEVKTTREDALRKALLDGYDNAVFPWVGGLSRYQSVTSGEIDRREHGRTSLDNRLIWRSLSLSLTVCLHAS